MESLARFRERIPPIPAWGRIAIFLAIALVAYFGFIGVRYWTAQNQTAAATTRIEEIDSSLGGKLSDLDELRADLEARTELLEDWKEVYSFNGYEEWQRFFGFEDRQGSDLLVAVITATADQAGVQIRSLRSGQPSVKKNEGLEFQVHTFRLSAAAENHFDFYVFVSLLHQSLPILRVSDITVAGFGSGPTADIDVQFFTLAEADEEEEA